MNFLTSTASIVEVRKMSTSKTKNTIHEFEQQVKEIRCQLAEQLRCLESRTETQTAILAELSDYYRRRAELDGEYGKQLEKLARSAMQRHKNEKNKREYWSLHSSCALWQQLVDDTREEARQRIALSDLYANHVASLISNRADDLHRLSRKCREIGALAHGEISRVLSELHTAMKTYQLCFAECAAVEAKYRQAEEVKLRYEEENPTKLGTTRKHRSLAKVFDKRLEKFDVVKVKCLKARNEYLLCIGAANAALHKYFADDLSDLIDCMDLGMEQWQKGLIACTISARKAICQKEMDALADLCDFKQALDAKADKQRFFEANHATFMLPKRFEFKKQGSDSVESVSAAEGVAEELQQRHMQIERRLSDVRLESEEIWKTLESTEKGVAEKHAEGIPSVGLMLVTDIRKESTANGVAQPDVLKNRHDLNELYDYYLGKFSHYLLNSNLIERLEARANGIASALCEFSSNRLCEKQSDGRSTATTPTTPTRASEDGDLNSCVRAKRKKRIGSGATAVVAAEETRLPRLFGGSLDEYVEARREPIPLIITSTIRVLSQFALHHQGIFRISGSQIEINAFKDAFERGEDPLREVVDASDVNSVAGVLKLYLRELREPLFPIFLFDQLIECAKCSNPEEFVKQVSPLLQKLSQPTFLVLRYLFAFLNHLSEFSDENMMDPYNLAICFGPTLLPIPDGKDQVFYHNFVNELVKFLIVYHEQVFPNSLPGPRYEKYLVETDQALFIDEQEGATSGDEEVVSMPPGDTVEVERSAPPSESDCGEAAECQLLRLGTPASGSVASTSFSKRSPPLATSSYLYTPVLHYQPDPNLGSGNSNNLLQFYQPTLSQRAPSLCSTNSTRSGAGCLDSAFLVRRYGSEEGPSSEGQASECVQHSFAGGIPTNAQVWTRRAAGGSSLREQLHHSRTQRCEPTRQSLEDENSFLTNRARNHRLSLHTVSPPVVCVDGSGFAVKVEGGAAEAPSSCCPHSNPSRELSSLRDRLAALSPLSLQVQNELKRRVLGEERVGVEPDLVRSLPHEPSALPSQASRSPQNWPEEHVSSPSSMQ